MVLGPKIDLIDTSHEWITSTAFLQNKLANKSAILLPVLVPPVQRNLLVRCGDEVSALPARRDS